MSIKRGNPEPQRPVLFSLAPYLLQVAERGDPAYLAKPACGEFAVLDLAGGKKRFYAAPRGSDALHLTLLVEAAFCAPAERVEEFVWVV